MKTTQQIFLFLLPLFLTACSAPAPRSGTAEQRDEHIRLLDGQVEALATMLVEQDETVCQLQRRPRFLTDDDWNNLLQLADRVYDGFTSRLAGRFPRLTAADRQIALLIRLRFTNVQMAQLLAVSPASVSQQRFRLKKRMMQTEEELFKEGRNGGRGAGEDLTFWDVIALKYPNKKGTFGILPSAASVGIFFHHASEAHSVR